MRYTLMNQRHEVLSFSYVPESRRVEDVRPLDDVAWAPLEVPTDGRDPTPALAGFLRTRAIALSRSDLPHILHACGATSAVELALRQAPLFDHGRAFLFLKDRFEAVHDSPAALMLILGRYFSRLDPSWDYSWYDPHALDGFEDEVLETLSTLGSLPDGYAELMATLFVKQRDYVNYVAQER